MAAHRTRTFDEIEQLFSRLLAALSPVFSTAELAEVQEFVDVGEYGLAWHAAAAIHREEYAGALPEVAALLRLLAQAMSMDAATCAPMTW